MVGCSLSHTNKADKSKSLRVIYEASGDTEPRVDFVAVHGLNFRGTTNHGTSTWEKEGKLWIGDFLPHILSVPARMMLYEYNSSPAINSAAINLDDHAKKLLLLLDLKRTGQMAQRPLAFICHSLGGLLVKEALVEATLDDSYSDIVKSTQMLVFFGTPHRGGNLASVGEYVAKLYRAVVQNPGNDMVDALRESSNSATKRYEQFRHRLEDFFVISCFETLPYSKTTGIIVDKDSATLNLPGKREKQISIEADHSSMCKFASPEDIHCEMIMAVIARQLELALTKFVDTRREELLALLNYPNRRAREAQIRNVTKQDDTFEWIWKSPFATWLLNCNQIFWIRGKPASGKSTLINHISQDLHLLENLHLFHRSHKTLVVTFYFDFRQGTTLANTVKGMFLTILHSLVSRISELAALLRADFPDWENIYQDGEWDLAALQKVVSRSLSKVGRPVCLFLDGLDEFCGSNEEQLDLALYLKELSSLGNINVCFASRPHDVMNRVFGSGPLLDMQDWNLPGLIKYISKAFEKIGFASNRLDAAHTNHLSELIANMADGVFLWAKFAVEDMIELWKTQRLDFASLLLQLAQLPSEVEKLWDKRREQLKDSEREASSALIRTVCSAARPLRLFELVDIIRRQVKDQGIQELLVGSQDDVQQIIHLSCGLLETKTHTETRSPGHRTVILVHKSVRRYIEIRGWWLSNDETKNPEQTWLEECASLINDATYARERSLCYQNKPHDISNLVCKSYGCYKDYPAQGFPKSLYEELHGGIERAILNNSPVGFMSGTYNLIKRRKLTFMKKERITSPLIPYVFHWFAYHAWILERRRHISCLATTSPILCPELIILMSSFKHHSCAFCNTLAKSPSLSFHGANDILPAFESPPVHRDPGSDSELRSGPVIADEETYTEKLSHSLFVSNNFVHTEGDQSLELHESRNIPNSVSVSSPVAEYICLMDFTRIDMPARSSMPSELQGSRYIRGPPKQRKIAVIGGKATGISSLVVQFVDGHYVSSYYPTIENSFSKVIRYNGQDFATEIIDTAGQDEYSILNSKHFIGVHGYMLVYSVKSEVSFEMIHIIMDKILNHLGSDSVPMVIVGHHNEAPSSQREVTYSEGKMFAEEHQLGFVEASSRNNENVNLAFELMIAQIEKQKGGSGEPEAPSSCTTM